jgi:hypothetical protein
MFRDLPATASGLGIEIQRPPDGNCLSQDLAWQETGIVD